jgi:transposase
MWGLDAGLRLWVCQQPVSMLKGIRGLSQMVWSWSGHSPIKGDVYVFFSRDRRMMKALRWDGDGFLMYTKKLSRGRFREVPKHGDNGARQLQWDDFYMLMRGLTPVKIIVEDRFRMAAK